MIIINVKTLVDFKSFFWEHRGSEYLFYDIRHVDNDALMVNPNVSGEKILFLQFLGSLGSSTILYQHVMMVDRKREIDDLMNEIREDINMEGLRLVEGTIREIFMSIS